MPLYFIHRAKIFPRIDKLESILDINIKKFKVPFNLEMIPKLMFFMNILN